MKKRINEKYIQQAKKRNDIYRKFQKQYGHCFKNPINISDNLYVEHSTNEYDEAFDLFFDGHDSDIKFFVGFTGVGKTTFVKHYFGHKTLGIKIEENKRAIIPNGWDGKKISNEGYEREIDEQISNILFVLIRMLYKSYEKLFNDDYSEILNCFFNTRTDIVCTLNDEEILRAKNMGLDYDQIILNKMKDKYPVEVASTIIKYIIEKHNIMNIKRLIFIVDDLETLSQLKVQHIVKTYFKLYSCLHNTNSELIVNLLICVRPHTFRFLQQNIPPIFLSAYGHYLKESTYRIFKTEIPNVKKIFIKRFEHAESITEKPKNQESWDNAKELFFQIIEGFNDDIIKMISDLCHNNIRAITDCFQMIFSNRIWCQDFDEYTKHPTVEKADYHFDVVNVIRTLACGESPIYMGEKSIQFNIYKLGDEQTRATFDESKVFIPNLIVDINTQNCDILPLLIVKYLDGFFSSEVVIRPQSEFICRRELEDNLYNILGDEVEKNKISANIDYLFENRIIRKSIISKDSDEEIKQLNQDDYIYLTLKGSRLLSMLKNDSVLVEIYREDIAREYSDDKYFKSSFELRQERNIDILFEDVINLVESIFYSEDHYIKNIKKSEKMFGFYDIDFPITKDVLQGVNNSIEKSQSIEENKKNELRNMIRKLVTEINIRKKELNIP